MKQFSPKFFGCFLNFVFLNHLTNCQPHGIPPLISLNDESASNPSEQCSLFARHLSSVFVDPGVRAVQTGSCNTSRDVFPLTDFAVDIPSVLSSLTKLKLSFTPGPDGMPYSILKNGVLLFCSPLLSRIFSRSMNEGSFPSVWKSAWLVATHKNGGPICRV